MKKILVVDDEPEVAELMRLFLGTLGYEADICLSCEDTLKAMAENKYWAVFCDYLLPKITGDLLFVKIKDADAALAGRFVLLTGAVLDEPIENFLKLERVKIINKPFNFEDLKKVLVEFESV